MNVIKEVNYLRGILENHKWRMTSIEYHNLTVRHQELFNEHHVLKDCQGTNDTEVHVNHVPILDGYTRIVIGAHGPYYEFTEKNLVTSVEITKGQEWRTLPKYHYVKYLHLNPLGMPDIKIYKQKKAVAYADYRPGFMYMDCWV